MKMDTCSTSFAKKKSHMEKEKKKRGYKCENVGMVGETRGSDWHGVKVAT